MAGEAVKRIDEALLRAWPLPVPEAGGDKEERGRALIVAGSKELPGAAVLAGTAALRAGAGKLMIASGESVAGLIAQSLPEARVLALPETKGGGFAIDGVDLIAGLAEKADAVLVGPGMQDSASAGAFARVLWAVAGDKPVIFDAAAMDVVMEGESFGVTKAAMQAWRPPVRVTCWPGFLSVLPHVERRWCRPQPGALPCMRAPAKGWASASERWGIWRVSCRRRSRH